MKNVFLPTKRFLCIVLSVLAIMLLAACYLAAAINSSGMTWSIKSIVHHPLAFLRFSRIALAALCGAALAGAGSALQALLKNPLADPYSLGVSGGASMFAVLAIGLVAFPAPSIVLLASIIGALLSTGFVLWAIHTEPSHSRNKGILVGVAINAFSAAIIGLVRILLPADRSQNFFFWMMGSVTYPSIEELMALFALVTIGLTMLIRQRGALDLLALGDNEATRLGMNIKMHKLIAYGSASLLVGATVSIVGTIGFVGLVVPQALRRILTPEQKILLPASILGGAILLVLCDTISRWSFRFADTEIPAGAVTALIGAPLFAMLLIKKEPSP